MLSWYSVRGCPWGLQFCPNSLGRAALLSPRPAYHPAFPAPFTAKAGKDPSGHGRMGQSQHCERCPLGGRSICASLSIPIVL